MRRMLLSLLILLPVIVSGKDPYPLNPNLDVIHYRFELELSEISNLISGKATLTIRLKSPEYSPVIDLVSASEGFGMKVFSISSGENDLKYRHENDKLTIDCPIYQSNDTLITVSIWYEGVPADGLIISNNKYGQKSFFGDNWPDRARNWLPCVDHLSDKATVDFLITAPTEYQVVAVGYRKSVLPIDSQRTLTIYSSEVPLPTKVMVIGVSQFAMQVAGFAGTIPVETWVYPENQSEGFLDYQPAVAITNYFSNKIGPYAFEKLANVQSKTIYGGMENSGAIFYYENSVTGKNNLHSLLAHEIAHQWFGDAVSEKDWHHIWLSEGFATYLEAVCMDELFRKQDLREKMDQTKRQVIRYHERNPSPIVDTTITDLKRLLNANSYQKGAWVLHMLRNEMGDEDFWKGMRLYYHTYKNRNALTDDFRYCMENAGQTNLQPFFDQWIFSSGHPVLKTEITRIEPDGSAIITITQMQTSRLFDFPLELLVKSQSGQQEYKEIIRVSQETTLIRMNGGFEAYEVIPDPNGILLFEKYL